MKYLSGIALLVVIFSSHAFACDKMKKNKSVSVLNIESTKTTQVEAFSVSDKNLIAEESSIKKSLSEGKKYLHIND